MAISGTAGFSYEDSAILVKVEPRVGCFLMGLAVLFVFPAILLMLLGSVVATMYVDGKAVDQVSWSWNPPRALLTNVRGASIEAEVNTETQRAVKFSVDGEFREMVFVV